MKYLITGLPRSRTAWMAEFMPNCAHEPVGYMQKIEDLQQVYSDFDGVSDSGMGFWLGWILEHIKPRTVIIERPIEEVEASLMAMGTKLPATNFCDLLLEELAKFHDHPLVMRVPFNALGNVRVMQKVWWHLLGASHPFDEQRFERMNALKIETSPIIYVERTIMQEIMPRIRLKGEPSCQYHG